VPTEVGKRTFYNSITQKAASQHEGLTLARFTSVVLVTSKIKVHPTRSMKTAAALLSAALSVPATLLAASAPVPPPPPLIPPTPPTPALPPATPPPVVQLQPPGRAIADAGRFAVALSSLSASQKADFANGKVEFLNVEDPASGLGPIFNDVSCVACHFQGGAGGASRTTVTRFGRITNGAFDPMTEFGGPLLQRRAIAPQYLEVVPHEATIVIRRITTPLFGAGLIEAIPDATLTTNAGTSKPDGIKGKAATVKDPISGQMHVGRFGWKAQHSSLDGFAADAYLNEIGITSRYFPEENAPNGNKALLAKADKILDPEDALASGAVKSDLNLAADYMRLLAPVPPANQTAAVVSGQTVFAQTGCANCHTPTLTTGASPIAALANQKVNLYSDLLLHDMGKLGDGMVQGAATEREMRTAPLWGLRLRDVYLHDGRASTLDLAVLAHDGEAKIVRDRYATLPAAKRQALLAFLNSL